MFARWRARREDPEGEAARALYIAIVGQARQPGFYRDCGVPDSVDGRFELIVLHAFLVLRRLKQESEPGPGAALGQRLFDLLFQDMDRSLREMGVGDLGVGKRIKDMVQAFYGRVSAYEAALEDDAAALGAALERNLLGTARPGSEQVAALAGYVEAAAAGLDAQPFDALIAGRPDFPAVPALSSAE